MDLNLLNSKLFISFYLYLPCFLIGFLLDESDLLLGE